ncbi:MAG TPA: hypothetical protein VG603_06690 [Chitinophagales bacterium]|nr:hypothetical protein [Chitinophagales bacterium]
MLIKNIDGLTLGEIETEIERGGKFVYYLYTFSILVMTFKRPTDIYFVKGGESATGKGLAYTAFTLVVGWWGIPWGPIYSIQSLVTNLGGGTDVTQAVLNDLRKQAAQA